jgi:subfamily B ATP-binding cassette protein MsbA
MNDFRRLFRFIRPYFGTLAVSLCLLALAGVFEVLTTAPIIPLFDEVLNPTTTPAKPESGILNRGANLPQSGGNSSAPVPTLPNPHKLLKYLEGMMSLLPGSMLTQIALSLLAFTLLKGLSFYYANFLMSRVGQEVVTDLRNQLFAHVLEQSMGFFVLNSTGQLMSRMNSDVEQIQDAVSTTISELFREIVLLVALLLWALYLDWRFAGLSLLIAPAALVLTLTMGRRIRNASLRSRENIATLSDLLQQSITGMRIVKAFGMEWHERERFERAGRQLFGANLRAARILFMNSPLMEILGVACFIPLLYYASERIASKTLTLGIFSGCLATLFRMYDPIRKLSRIHVQFQKAFASTSRINELFDTHIEIQDSPDAQVLDGVRQSIEFRNVSFNYGDEGASGQVLTDVNLQARCRQVIALVGSSGSGKSTLVSLVPRFYEATRGAVLIDGVDVRGYTQQSLRKNIALVTQETFLFNETVRNNIAYGNPAASENQIIDAARAALAHDFIIQLPMGYGTLIGERGQRLSGGERQRISIARAILKNAPILILDEATSALDSESEKLVQQALANLMRDRTTFVIAHRLSTIRNADLIVVLQQGQIAEMGTHDDLIDLNRLYYRFFKLQTDEAFASSALPLNGSD